MNILKSYPDIIYILSRLNAICKITLVTLVSQ